MHVSRWMVRKRVEGLVVGFVVVVLAGLTAGTCGAGTAYAHVGPCRTDPYVVLSNGYKVRLVATIGDDVSDVQQITFTLHAPAGSRVTKIGYDPGMAKVEIFQFYSDNPRSAYDVDTYVVTGADGVAVTSTTSLVNPSGKTVDSKSANGTSKQHLHTHVAG